jgi:hypothetical protein
MQLHPTHEHILTSTLRLVFKIQPNKMLRQPPIRGLIDLVKDEVQQIESRDESWRQIDISRNRQLWVILGVDRVGSGED